MEFGTRFCMAPEFSGVPRGLGTNRGVFMIKLRADVELKDTIVMTVPKLVGEGFSMCTIRIEYEWKPPSSSSCNLAKKGANSDVVSSLHGTSFVAFGSPTTTPLVERIDDLERQMMDEKLMLVDEDGKPLKKVDDPVNADSDSEVEKVFNETASFMTSTSSKVDSSSKSASGVGNNSFYEQ
ncbi:hypothetical protein Tco_1430924 [Tanacetum coccineum]